MKVSAGFRVCVSLQSKLDASLCRHHSKSCTCKGARTLIIARVVLGDACVVTETRPGMDAIPDVFAVLKRSPQTCSAFEANLYRY